MTYFWALVLILINLICLSLVVFMVPGNWLMVIATGLFAWWRWEDGFISIYTLAVITALAILGELFELLGGAGAAKSAGASFWGSVAAICGAIGGAVLGTFLIPIPVLGTLLGSSIAAAAMAAIVSGSAGHKRPMRLAVTTGLGQFFGASVKLVLGVLIWVVVAIAAFWP
jgi:hypothetical protein